ncbi:unnamed protein product [Clavelina lepadiformis]|uniref:Uncharacterized protein n=1 Tax=Clavelina lepadiformis TaxID=159417 RepID=A0ABP0G374_CLALP
MFNHENFSSNYPPKSDIRKSKLTELKSALKSQQRFIKVFSMESDAMTEASFVMSQYSKCVIKCQKKSPPNSRIIHGCKGSTTINSGKSTANKLTRGQLTVTSIYLEPTDLKSYNFIKQQC